MTSPASQKEVVYPEFSSQPPLQVASAPDLPAASPQPLEHTQSYPEVVEFQGQDGWVPPQIHVHHTVPLPSFAAELPASLGPAGVKSSTSSPQDQPTQDGALAQKLHQMEFPRARSHSDLRQQVQQIPRKSISPQAGQLPYPQSPQQKHASLQYGGTLHSQASQPQLAGSPLNDLASFAPQVVPDIRPMSMYSVQSDAPPGYASPTFTIPGLARQTPVPQAFTPPMPSAQVAPVSTPVAFSAPHPLTAHLPPAPAPEDRAALSTYLETHHAVPYPPQWILPPVSSTLYGSVQRASKTDWLDQPEAQLWHATRSSHNRKHPTLPSFKISFEHKGGSFRDHRYSWVMTTPSALKSKDREKPTWTYELRLERKTSKRVSEELLSPPNKDHKKGRSVNCTYLHAPNYSTLTFLGPDGRRYKWVSHAPVTSINGARFDTLRHALFVDNSANGNRDPLYGHIVADHCFWDGFKSPGCLPDEALYIRSESEDIQFIVGTLQIMKDWEKIMLGEEKKESAVRFASSQDLARGGNLGRRSYWVDGDSEEVTVSDEKIAISGPTTKKEDEKKAKKEAKKSKRKSSDKEGGGLMVQQAMRSTLSVSGLGLGDGSTAMTHPSGAGVASSATSLK